jgi:beta propeller repeat protein
MERKFLSISLALTLLILASTVASACNIQKIGSGSEPAIDGNKIAWTDGGVIHVYDLATKNDTKIGSSAASHPAISGNKLVWFDKSTGVPKFTVYDIKTKARSYITKNIDTDSVPAIYGSRIVWSAIGNVYVRDISKSTQTKIAAGSNPDVYGNKISYDSDSAGDTPQIYVYDITTKKAIDVSQYGDNIASHIYGNKVIWSDFYTRLGNIRMYDIATRQQKEVTTGDYKTGYDTGGATDISGNRIAYLKHNDLMQMDLGNVYVYDIATGKSKQLSSGNTAQTPAISGNVVIWSGSGSIYMTNY